jgi:PGF-pre-PGF domain-containing protein
MKKLSTIFISLILLVSLSTALDARIDESDSGQSTVDVVLKPSNNYSYTANYSSTTSTGDIKNREWTLVGTGQTDSGVAAQFKFDRGMDDPENVKLVASDGDTADDFQISQPVQDIPNASISADSVEVEEGESVDFTSRVTNEFENDSLQYSWKWGGEGGIGDGTSAFTHTFESQGTYEVKLEVSDSAGSYTTDPITIDVSSGGGDGPSGGGGGGGGLGALPQDTKDKKTSEKPEKASNRSKERRGKTVKKVTAESRNGVAKVTIQKGEGTKNISVRVDPASDKASVKRISITSDASGEVKVSVSNLGRDRPKKVPEPASEKVYSYQEINASINDTEIDAAEVDFRVNDSWLQENNATVEEVVMKRYSENQWRSLETRHINSTANYHNFETSSNSFSYYAVALEQQEPEAPQDNRTDTEDSPEETGSGSLPLMILLPLILAVAAIFLYREKLFGGDRRSELEEELEEIEQDIMDGGLEEADSQQLVEQVEEASSLINQGKLEEAEELIEEMKKELE